MKTISNPPNPYESTQRELLELPAEARLELFEDTSQSILTANDSPDISFRWSLNPYRGCFHSCAYCYARRHHEFLGMGAGTDFESKLIVKQNAPQLLRAAFMKKSWKGEVIVFSGGTDCYQPLEATYKITQQCLNICSEFRNPVSIITKSFLVTRDLDILMELHRKSYLTVTLSIPFSSDDDARNIEPQASTIERRFEAVGLLAKAGLNVGISLAPTIPGLNEKDIPMVMKRGKELGAKFAFHSLMRLPGSVKQVFFEKIRATLAPERVERIEKRLREMRDGALNDSRFGSRMEGHGTYWKAIEDLFRISQNKYGLDDFPDVPDPSPFRRPSGNQLEFDI